MYVYYAAGTDTKILIQTGWLATNAWQIYDLLLATGRLVTQRIAVNGDRVIPVSDLVVLGNSMITEGIYMTLKNANNHQLTYGVVQAAVSALSDFLNRNGGFKTVDFQIIDGKNLVGTGQIMG
ncbi:MAG: hypothetical protein LQ347_006834 [Umbilicaria vellea]|nr:MAG: hypothetical protein LQ347_006834 [Umbilicaria vellea]